MDYFYFWKAIIIINRITCINKYIIYSRIRGNRIHKFVGWYLIK